MLVPQSHIDSILCSSETLSENTHSDCARSSVSYRPDLPPYSTATPFAVSAHCNPSILTPTSNTNEPSLQDPRLVGQYPEPPAGCSPHAQEPTPPDTSKMYHQGWSTPQFDMNGQHSESHSPMRTPGQLGSNDLMCERRTPGPPETYMGSYAVSDASQPTALPHTGSPYYMDMGQMPSHGPALLRGNHHPLGLEQSPREVDRNIVIAAPLLSDVPRDSSYRRMRRLSDNDDVLVKTGGLGGEAMHSPNDLPRRLTSVVGNGRARKSHKKKASKGAQMQASEEHTNCHGDEIPPLLKDSCPEEERRIFESRWRHRYKRGQDMWDFIQGDFRRKFHKNQGKEMLQMKFRRARSKYIQWLSKDEEILRDAWKVVEQRRYQDILDCFLEMGGSHNMRLNASDIEVKLAVDLKLEEHLYMPGFQDIDIRRRRKISTRRRSSGRRGNASETSIGPDIMGLDPRHIEDEVIAQAQSRWQAASTNHGDLMDVAAWDNRSPAVKLEPEVDGRDPF